MEFNSWQRVELGDVCLKIGSGATPRGGQKVYLDAGEYKLIRSQNVYNEGFSAEGLVFLTEHHAKELSSVELELGDVLLNITGDSVARCCQVNESHLPGRVNQHVCIIRPDPKKLNPQFLRYWLISPQMQTLMLSWADSGGTRKALTKGMIESFEIPCPPLDEQKAIAHILGTLDDKIELNQQMNRTLEAIARALFKSWFIDFDPVRAKLDGRQPAGMDAETAALFPAEFEDSAIGKIPKGWKVVPLPEAIEVNPTRSLSKGKNAPYLDMKNMPTQGHRPDGWIYREFGSGTKFIQGDTLLARITPCLENGKTAFVDFLHDGEVGWGSTEYIIFRPKAPLPVEFGYFLARSDELRNHAIVNMTGSSGRQRVPVDCFSSYLLAVPSDSIARRFGQAVVPFMKIIKANSEQNSFLISIRDVLSPNLLSGRVCICEVEEV